MSSFMLFSLQGVLIWSRDDVMFTCGSCVLITSYIIDTSDIIISEIEKAKLDSDYLHVRKIRKIARMPLYIVIYFQKKALIIEHANLMFDFQGTEYLVRIKYWERVQ